MHLLSVVTPEKEQIIPTWGPEGHSVRILKHPDYGKEEPKHQPPRGQRTESEESCPVVTLRVGLENTKGMEKQGWGQAEELAF